MKRRTPGGLVGQPIILLLLASACGAAACGDTEATSTSLESIFPEKARDVVASSRGFDATATSFVLAASNDAWGQSDLHVMLPKSGAEPVRMRLDALGLEIEVFEIDLTGDADREGTAIRYRREGGVSYWSGVPGGVEEWLVIDDGVKSNHVPVASWIVSGATLFQRGPAVVVYDPSDRRAHIQVTADEAYGPDGQPLRTQLRVVGDRIDLFVEESRGPVLVDPLWVDLTTMQVGRYSHAATLLPNDTILVAGGAVDQVNTATATAEIYTDLAVPTWTAAPAMNNSRFGHTLTTLDDGTAFVHGGDDGFGFPVWSPEIYDPAQASWSDPTGGSGGSFCGASGFHTATKLGDGRVLFTGGYQFGQVEFFGPSGNCATTCVELWNPAFDQYEFPMGSGGFLNDWRAYHGAAQLNDGRVLLSGGEDCGFYLSSAEVFEPVAEVFNSVASMFSPRAAHSLTTLCDGRVLAVGGIGGNVPQANTAQANAAQGLGPLTEVLDTGEIYDPAANSWSLTTNTLLDGRYSHTATLLDDCTVLIVGGYTDLGTSLDSAEIFDPNTNSFTITADITGGRGEARATKMANGNVLVSGGFDAFAGTTVNTSMEYQPLKVDGEGCVLGGECLSGFCIDGVCCNTQCDSDCEACTATLQGGGADGTCGPVAQGTDPDGNCADQGLATCGTNGACDGSGTCAVYALGTVCNPGSCAGDDVVNADTCNGDPQTPACVDNATTDCGAYTCSAATCLSSCATSTDCAGLHYCDVGTNECMPQLDNGMPAVDEEQCLSGNLADGVCCDTACDNGICDACTVAEGATVDGTCAAIITCSDDNSCTLDACHPVNGCVSNSVLDGAACDGGICVAGTCIPDPDVNLNGSGGIQSGSGSGAAGGADSTGAAGKPLGDPRLEGGGICQATMAGGPEPPSHQRALWWLLAAAPFFRRRRRR